MITPVTVFMTNDGKYHSSYKEAVKHIENAAQEELDGMLKGVALSSHSDLVKVVTALAGDIGKVKRLHSALFALVQGMDDDGESEDGGY